MSNRKIVKAQQSRMVDVIIDSRTASLQRMLDVATVLDRDKPAFLPKPSIHALATVALALVLLAMSFVFAPISQKHGGPSECGYQFAEKPSPEREFTDSIFQSRI